MKKALLLSAGLLAASIPMSAQFKATQLDNAPFMGISQNGKYGIFTIDGIMLAIVDLENPEDAYVYMDDREELYIQNEYFPGYGTCVANDGTAVGNAVLYEKTGETTYDQTDNAVIYKDGDLTILPSPHPDLINMAHAITPDGSMICGIVGNDNFGIDSRNVMMLPAVWTRNAQGEYDAPVLLPHPDKDFLGGVPQHITANAISADGNVVAGTITASSGFWVYPIVYKRDAAGEWSYSLPSLNLFYTHPEVEVPENPGDYPDKEDFMTDEEKAAYAAALQAWKDAGGTDYSTYPDIDDFMTDEEKAAYDAACQKYMADKEAYDAAVDEATAGSITLTFNNVVLSPDGKTFYSTYVPDSGFGPLKPGKLAPKHSPFLNKGSREEEADPKSTVYAFNLEDDSYKTYTSADGVNVTCAGNNGMLVGYSGDLYSPKACVIDPVEGVKEIQDYYAESCPELTAWINENMSHEVEVYDPDADDTYMDTQILSGIPFCTPDMKTVTTYVSNTFDVLNPAYFFGYVFQGLPEIASSGVKDIPVKDSKLSVQRGGIVSVDGEAYVEVFAADGSKVFAGNAAGVLNTGLRSGIYVVRARFANGDSATVKAMF